LLSVDEYKGKRQDMPPFIIHQRKIAITVMRKKDFKAKDPVKFKV